VHQRVDQIGRQRHNDNQQDDGKNIGHTPVYPANSILKSQAVHWEIWRKKGEARYSPLHSGGVYSCSNLEIYSLRKCYEIEKRSGVYTEVHEHRIAEVKAFAAL
jgi:hypothetical protein